MHFSFSFFSLVNTLILSIFINFLINLWERCFYFSCFSRILGVLLFCLVLEIFVRKFTIFMLHSIGNCRIDLLLKAVHGTFFMFIFKSLEENFLVLNLLCQYVSENCLTVYFSIYFGIRNTYVISGYNVSLKNKTFARHYMFSKLSNMLWTSVEHIDLYLDPPKINLFRF